MTTRPYRLIVTGSRDWADEKLVTRQLTALLAASTFIGDTLTVVHGSCRTGADAHADRWAEWHRARGALVEVERHRAEDFGPWPACGPIRNRHMVSLGADACLAFIGPCARPACPKPKPHGSHGATGCTDLAEAAGIPVRRFTP